MVVNVSVRSHERTGVQKTGNSGNLAAVDWFSIIFLGVTFFVLLSLAPANRNAVALAVLHGVWIAFLLIARRIGIHRTRAGELLLAFYPLPLFALLYSEFGFLDAALHPGVFFDEAIQGIEGSIFGEQPSQELHRRLPSLALGEFLHLGYLSYYFLAPVFLVVLWFSGRRGDIFERSVGTISLSFYISFLIFISYPVAGPYHMFEPPLAGEVGWFLPEVTRWVLDRGSSVGAAFPSSHVAVAVSVWILALRYQTRIAIVYSILVPALGLGAIYGGYHYVIDVLAGAALGILVGTAGHALTCLLARRRTKATPT